MRDTGSELPERGELLCLDQAVLRGAQFLQRLRQFARARLNAVEQRTFSIAITAWSAKVLTSSICFSVNGCTSERAKLRTPIGAPFPQQWNTENGAEVTQSLVLGEVYSGSA